jgi:phosphoenolpyruvate carboxykinase (ATP)
MITAALNGELNDVDFRKQPHFWVEMPRACPACPRKSWIPRDILADKEAYDKTAADLAQKFVSNFQKYADFANERFWAGAPKAAVEAGV